MFCLLVFLQEEIAFRFFLFLVAKDSSTFVCFLEKEIQFWANFFLDEMMKKIFLFLIYNLIFYQRNISVLFCNFRGFFQRDTQEITRRKTRASASRFLFLKLHFCQHFFQLIVLCGYSSFSNEKKSTKE